MQPKTRLFDTFSNCKGVWKGAKKIPKKLTIQPNGDINILWETEDDFKEEFTLSEVH